VGWGGVSVNNPLSLLQIRYAATAPNTDCGYRNLPLSYLLLMCLGGEGLKLCPRGLCRYNTKALFLFSLVLESCALGIIMHLTLVLQEIGV